MARIDIGNERVVEQIQMVATKYWVRTLRVEWPVGGKGNGVLCLQPVTEEDVKVDLPLDVLNFKDIESLIALGNCPNLALAFEHVTLAVPEVIAEMARLREIEANQPKDQPPKTIDEIIEDEVSKLE